MCSDREEKFVVPKKPAAGMGWWIGSVLSKTGKFLELSLLWVEFPENCSMGNVIYSTSDSVAEYNNVIEAFSAVNLKSEITQAAILA